MDNKLVNPRKIRVGSNTLNYFRQGNGEPMILVHGITTYSFIWRNLVPELKKHFDVIAVDLLGCGDSDKNLDTPYSLKQHSIILKGLLGKLNIEKLHFVGHDVGGGIAQIFTVNYPEMVLTTTMINSVAYDFWPVQPIIAMRTPIIRQLAMASLDMGMFKLLVRKGLYHKNRVNDALMRWYWKPMKSRQGRKAFLYFARCLDNRDLLDIEDEIRKIESPVMIVRGNNDIYLSAGIAERLHSEIPHSYLVKVETAGHYIQEDEPGFLTEILIGFCKTGEYAGRGTYN